MKIQYVVLLSLLFISCDKENNDPPEPSNTDHLTSAQWQYDNGGIDQDKNGSIDFSFSSGFVPVPACVLDNKATFNDDGTGVADEGAVKSNASSSQTNPFTWSFSNNETKINVTGSAFFGAGGQFDIATLNGTKLSIRKDTTMPGSSQSVWMVVDFKH